MKVLVSGGSGFLGSSLLKHLATEHQAYALVRTSSSLSRLRGVEEIYIVYIEELEDLFSRYKFDVVINTAALYGRNGESFGQLLEANLIFPIRLYELCTQTQVPLFINTGTALDSSVSYYARTKNMFSDSLAALAGGTTKIVDLNLEHFYGYGDDTSKFTTFVIKSCLGNIDLELTDGLQRRDFIHLQDVLSAITLILSKQDQLDGWQSVDLGSGEAVRVRDFVQLVKELSNSSSALKFGVRETRENEPSLCVANTEWLENLGWKSEFCLRRGLQQVIGGYVE